MQSNCYTLKSKACTLASKVKDIMYSWIKNATNYVRLLANILSEAKCNKLTSINLYIIPIGQALYNPSITNTMPTHKWKRKEKEWGLMQILWFICKGFLRGAVDNLRNALNKQNYSQLKDCLMAYHNITPYQTLEHLTDHWCPHDVQAKKALKNA